jgi:hypothetical protein
MDQSIIFLLAIIIILGAVLFAIIGRLTIGKCAKHLNVEQYRVRWLAIEHQLKREEPSSFHLSVLNADKLVDMALRERGFKGDTMGERLKNATPTLSDQNGIWNAHKLRNRIAHEPDAIVTYDEARYALSCFRKTLKDLGAI